MFRGAKKKNVSFWEKERFVPKSRNISFCGLYTELKVKTLSVPRNENTLSEFYPHFDDNDDMDAFIHRYQVNSNGMIRNSCTIWTADKIITAIDEMGGWVIKEVPNLFGKIPVVYADVFQPEWDEVALLMDAREMRISRMVE